MVPGILPRLALAIPALALCAATARAEKLTYEGEDVQRLECAAIYLAVAQQGFEAGAETGGKATMAMATGLAFLDGLPGTPPQKRRAVRDVGRRIVAETTPETLGDYLDKAAERCESLSR